MAAYAQYEARDYDAAVTTLDQFIQLHPGYWIIQNAAYSGFGRAVIHFARQRGWRTGSTGCATTTYRRPP